MLRLFFVRSISKFNNFLLIISGVVLVILMMVGAIDATLRYVFGHPIKGALNLSEVLLLITVFFAWPYNQSVDGNVKVEIFSSKFKLKNKYRLEIVWTIISIILFIIMAWYSAKGAIDSKDSYEIIDILNIPAYPFKLIVTIGVSVLCLQLITSLFNTFYALREESKWSQ